MREFTFAVDVDEVLRDNISNMLKVYNEEYGDNKTLSDIHDFQVDKVFTKVSELTGETASKYFFETHAQEVFTDADVIEGAKEAIDILRNYGKVIIVTYQKNTENKIRTLEWLDKHDIKFDSICFTRDKSIVNADYMIDDNDWNFIGCNCCHGILINRPYNQQSNLVEIKNKSNCCDISRFTSLKKFADWFRNNYEVFEKFETCDRKKETPGVMYVPYIVGRPTNIINNGDLEIRNEYTKFMEKYSNEHCACPKCGSTHHSSTLVAYVYHHDRPEEYKDLNKVTCTNCGWQGVVHDMVPERK